MPAMWGYAQRDVYAALLPLIERDFGPRLRRVTAEVLQIGDQSGAGVDFRLFEDAPGSTSGTNKLDLFGMRSQEVVAMTKLIEWGKAITKEVRLALSEPQYAKVAGLVGKSVSFWPFMPYAKWFLVYPDE